MLAKGREISRLSLKDDIVCIFEIVYGEVLLPFW